jgi:tetratricopeptide (TPR) repeat protein
MSKILQNIFHFKMQFSVSCAILLFVISCSGGRQFRVEFASGNDSLKRIQELAENQAHDNTSSKKLPEMTGDEYERLGDALLSKKKLNLAYVHYEKSLQLNHENSRVMYKKGLVLLYANKNNEAIEQFQIVLEKWPDFSPAYEGIGRAYLQKKVYTEAETHFLKALSFNHKLWRSHVYLGYIFDHRGDYQAAIREYKSAISVQPENGLIFNNLGISYSLAGKYKKAINAYKKAIKANYREPKVFNNLALSLANLNRYEEALDAFNRAGGEAQAYNNLGCVFLHSKEFKKAEKCFEKAIELRPSFYSKALENLKKAQKGYLAYQ